MPFVAGFLRVRRRRPGGGGPVDPDYGVDEGEIDGGGDEGDGSTPPDRPMPTPPPGIWPPLTPEHPWRPIPERPERPSTGPVPPGGVQPPAGGIGGRPPERPHPGEPDEELPPGSIWPPLPPGVHGKFLALVLIGGGGHGAHYRYVVVDADALPKPPAGGIGGTPPGRPEPTR